MHAIACTLDRAGANAVQVAGRECTVGGFMATASFTAAVEGTACLATLYGRPKSTEHIVNVQERGVPGASLPHTGGTDPLSRAEDAHGRSNGTQGGPAAAPGSPTPAVHGFPRADRARGCHSGPTRPRTSFSRTGVWTSFSRVLWVLCLSVEPS